MKSTFGSIMLALTVALTFCNCEYDHDLLGNWVNSDSNLRARPRGGATCFVIDNKAYLIGGRGYYKNETYYLDTWQFDPETASWTQYDTVPAQKGRYYGVGFAIDGKGYYGTGYGKQSVYFKDFYEFDPTQESGSQWTVTDSMPGEPIYGMVGFSINGIGYAGGGVTRALGYSNTYYAYNPKNEPGNKWSVVPNINPAKRCHGSVFIIDDRAYIIGGVNNGTLVSSFERFDPSYDKGEGRWFKISQNLQEDYRDTEYNKVYRQQAVAFSVNGRGYICCGASTTAAKTDVWEYIPFIGYDRIGVWNEVCAFEGKPRYAAQGFAVNGVGYVMCGMIGTAENDFHDDVWRFDPREDYDKRTDR